MHGSDGQNQKYAVKDDALELEHGDEVPVIEELSALLQSELMVCLAERQFQASARNMVGIDLEGVSQLMKRHGPRSRPFSATHQPSGLTSWKPI